MMPFNHTCTAKISSGSRYLVFHLKLYLVPYCMCASREDSKVTRWMYRLDRAFSGHLCKNLTSCLKSWLISSLAGQLSKYAA